MNDQLISMSYDDGLAVATLWQEARGSSREEQLAVAHVIRNRMAKRYTSDGTVVGTVLHPWQFSGWMDDAIALESLRYAATDAMSLRSIWNEALKLFDPTKGAVLYYSPASMVPEGSVPNWVTGLAHLTLETPGFRFYSVSAS